MACFNIARSVLSPPVAFRAGPFQRRFAPPVRLIRLRCHVQDSGSEYIWKDRPEVLFMRELRRRELVPPMSLLEESLRSFFEMRDKMAKAEFDIGTMKEMKRNGLVSAEADMWVVAAVDREELPTGFDDCVVKGPDPWGDMLLALGEAYLLMFWPYILITFVGFAVVCSHFGHVFFHDGLPPPHVDPHALLDDVTISPTVPGLN